MIYLCSVYDTHQHKGTCYCTAVKPMSKLATIECLVPRKDMVWGYRYHGLSEQDYTTQYFKLLSDRWNDVRTWLKSLSNDEDITLLCYCREGQFCHRTLIKRVINRYRPDITAILH